LPDCATTGVTDFETDATVDNSESDPTSKAAVTLQTLGAWAFDPAPVNYYGASVRTGYVNQPAAQIIELSGSRALASTGSGIVAIIDTGVDPSHPALASVLMTGYDFTRDQPGASEFADLNQSTVAILDQSTVAILDGKIFPVALNQSTVAILDQSTVAILDGGLPKSFGHGTMVAGLVHLVAPTARILPLKAFRADGTANLSDIVRAIRYAADNGATVLSMSFTFSTLSPDLQSAIQYAVSKGVICVASAGNNGSERAYYPAALEQVIGVGSTNYSDLRSPFSNYDNSAVTAAPGEAIVTTYPGNNYAAAWGTSFSAPLVAGAVALFDTVRPKLKIDDLDDVMSSGVAIHQNMGARLDLVKALTYCLHMN
jgi:subtilisin family serine protease